jgi:divinyl chlorophyllide a 8-vinyl-reductase
LLDAIAGALGMVAPLSSRLAEKAELARIGRYYASESMLWLNPETRQYDAAGTPSTGADTLFDYYASVIAGAAAPERGDHAVF